MGPHRKIVGLFILGGPMKFFTYVFIFAFISLAAYLLLNEKSRSTKHLQVKRIIEIKSSTRKRIGQIPNYNPSILELQRQRIRSETVYRFQSNDTSESYELDESDLDKFGIQLMDFKNLNRDEAPSIRIINERKLKRL